MNYDFYKRIIDISVSTIIFVIFLPILFFLFTLIIIIDLQNPIFTQKRSGKFGKKIKIYKLRSMKKTFNENHITKFGKFLRLSKLDELPQLINVINGTLSLIGPRPLYLEFNDHYQDNHKNRLKIKPGITGLAQVKVRDSTNWSRKFNFDIIYIRKISFRLDLYIFILTLKIIFSSLINKEKRPIESIDYKSNFFNKYKKWLFT